MADPRIDNADAKWLPSTNGVRMERIEFLSGGTGISDYMASADPAQKWLNFYCQTTAATGSAQGLYLHLNVNYASTGSFNAGRFYTTVTAALTTGSVSGVHATAELGTGGTETGQTASLRATWAANATTRTVSGTHYAVLAESDIKTGNTMSGQQAFVGFKDLGDVAMPYALDFTGVTAATTASFEVSAGAVGTVYGYINIMCDDGSHGYIPVYSSHA